MVSTQVYHDHEFLREVWALFAVGCTIFFLRFAVRLRTVGLKGFQGDDYLSIAVLACYTADAVTVTLCYLYGSNVDYTPEKLATLNDQELDQIVFGSRMQLLAWYTYTALIWGLKACMLFFFNRLTFGTNTESHVRVLAWVCGGTYIAVFLTITCGCTPIQHNWAVIPYPPAQCTLRIQNFFVCTILNVLTDGAMLCIPLPLLWKLRVALKRKLTLAAFLCSGIFVIAAAIIRIVFTLKANPSALTINRWGVRETIAGIIAVNLPILRPLFTLSFWTSKGWKPETSTGPSKHAGTSPKTSAKPSSRILTLLGKSSAGGGTGAGVFEMLSATATRNRDKDGVTITSIHPIEPDADNDTGSQDLIIQKNPSMNSSEDPDVERGDDQFQHHQQQQRQTRMRRQESLSHGVRVDTTLTTTSRPMTPPPPHGHAVDLATGGLEPVVHMSPPPAVVVTSAPAAALWTEGAGAGGTGDVWHQDWRARGFGNRVHIGRHT